MILCPGLPRSGTTSLWHMLREAKIFDIPWKEPHFLSVLSDDKTDLPTFFPKEFKNRYHQYVYDLNREYININPPYTLDVYKKYIEKSSYDFSQSYWYISEDYLRKIKESLSDFNIKIILLYREPVQRLYSFCNLVCNDWDLDFSPIELYYKFLNSDDSRFLYPYLYHKYANVFEKIICLKTETFFDSREEQERLLNFLELPLVNLKSVYINQSNVCNDWNLDFSPIELYYKFLNSDDSRFLYPYLYHKYANVFEKIICLKTETFFDSREEQERLLNFLELPLVNLKSVYINQSNVCNELSSDDINIGKQKLKPSYDFYHSL